MKDDFIQAMGGASAPVGSTGANVQALADALEELLESLTHAGVRVYPAELNKEYFWRRLTEILS